jgi:uncharacterized protein YdeI (YjbR/CyaY-like superfamily)
MNQLFHKDLPIISFSDGHEFYVWLAQNHTTVNAIWLRIYKKNSGIETVSYPASVDMALCWGWIDGLTNKYDEVSYLVRFTPRRPKSVWSKINVAKVERLIAQDLMQPPGLEHIVSAKKDGRWDKAY